ncbi:phosphatase PAP2 family protein [Flammeovirga sp. MY04]|uniref:phosphatase PAP2 family protein n=1 Tax=Flammeovirga sp. MY04 TaxID=1191459 RepID=UPI0008062434|nr:phosphatase PAP2 family protein [Flammeovirga sp. MY04]ANQ49674.1 phosphatase PAP2 family protein [Flammeovirga sp. MY04]
METKKKIYNILGVSTLLLFIPLIIALVTKERQTAWMVHLLNDNHSIELDYFFKYITNLGDGLFLIPLLGLVWLVKKEYWPVLVISAALHGILVALLKKVVFTGDALNLRPAGKFGAESFHQVLDVHFHMANSFPSGHTTTGFVIGAMIILLFPNWKGITAGMIYGFIVGISRMYLVQHFFLDVAVGSILGVFTVYLSLHICYNYNLLKVKPWKKDLPSLFKQPTIQKI